MNLLEDIEIVCPYCGEGQTTRIERGTTQDAIEDCQACCRPMLCVVQIDGAGQVSVTTRRDDE